MRLPRKLKKGCQKLETIQAIAEALCMTVDLIDPKLADLAPLRTLTRVNPYHHPNR